MPGSVTHALREVKGLQKGRTEAKERPPVPPVADAIVDRTVEILPITLAAMVQFQRLTGCRPEDVCRARPCDIDRTGDVWLYRPCEHKMEHKSEVRIVFIGPKCQAILTPYLFGGDAPCFKPARAKQYTSRSYRAALHRRIDIANRVIESESDKIPKWNPNQL